jgi:peptidoglycan/LPS O-acetylase OafA/YrhL
MALSSRIWQFMIGFLAYNLQQIQLFDGQKTADNLKKVWGCVQQALPYILILCLFVQIGPTKQSHRLLVILLTLIIISWPRQQLILCNFPMVELGNVSYSVYMIHWPLFQFYISMGFIGVLETYSIKGWSFLYLNEILG